MIVLTKDELNEIKLNKSVKSYISVSAIMRRYQYSNDTIKSLCDLLRDVFDEDIKKPYMAYAILVYPNYTYMLKALISQEQENWSSIFEYIRELDDYMCKSIYQYIKNN